MEPFKIFENKRQIAVKNFFLLVFLGISIYLFDKLGFVELEKGFILLGYNIFFVFLFLLLNFSEFKHILKLIQIVLFFHKKESHTLDYLKRNAQRLIFPSKMEDENFEVIAKMQPVTYLGGDVINYTVDKEGYYWFAIGDSSGHDLNSHLFSMMLMAQMNYFVNIAKDPMEMNQCINRTLEARKKVDPDLNISNYASLGILKSDKKGNFLHYGLHPNYIVFRKDKKDNDIIETGGNFIGIDIPPTAISKPEHSNRSFHMNSGDILFTFTDGLFEQRNKERKYYGYRLYEFIKSHKKENLSEFIDDLFASIKEFSGNKVDDDMTILIIRKK